ncbi:MAG: hypothetical protein KAR18_09115, partial [Spirochaetes bacterium]|nr:hypothetical protein [Spirochaetota bacterium]
MILLNNSGLSDGYIYVPYIRKNIDKEKVMKSKLKIMKLVSVLAAITLAMLLTMCGGEGEPRPAGIT